MGHPACILPGSPASTMGGSQVTSTLFPSYLAARSRTGPGAAKEQDTP